MGPRVDEEDALVRDLATKSYRSGTCPTISIPLLRTPGCLLGGIISSPGIRAVHILLWIIRLEVYPGPE